MNAQAISYLIVYAVVIGASIVLLVIFRGFLQWLLGVSDIIRLLKEQNKLLEVISTERTRNASKPIISKTDAQSR